MRAFRAFATGVVHLDGVPRRNQGRAIDAEIERCLETILEDTTEAHPHRTWRVKLGSVHYGELASRGSVIVTVVADLEPVPCEVKPATGKIRPEAGSAADPAPQGRTR